ncbi:MAG: AraC family transcriptional regulator [Hydrogeniiclostridium mannosilyticum]
MRFYDQFYFSRRFRSRYGLSPSQYRQSFRAQII